MIKINEGPRSVLHKITFSGNRVVNEATLYDYMIGATPERLARQPAKFPYTSAEISAGVDRVRGLYLSKGYLNVAIDSSGVQLSPDGKMADVTVRITEGPTFAIGELTFTGNTLYPRDKLVIALGESPNGPFAPGIAAVMQRNLQSYYKAHGYYQAEVTAIADPTLVSGGAVPISFAVAPGPLFRLGKVTVANSTDRPRLRPDFLPKRFAFLHGEVYDPNKLDETFREMLKTGLFDNLRVSLKPLADDEHLLWNRSHGQPEAEVQEIGFTVEATAVYEESVSARPAARGSRSLRPRPPAYLLHRLFAARPARRVALCRPVVSWTRALLLRTRICVRRCGKNWAMTGTPSGREPISPARCSRTSNSAFSPKPPMRRSRAQASMTCCSARRITPSSASA